MRPDDLAATMFYCSASIPHTEVTASATGPVAICRGQTGDGCHRLKPARRATQCFQAHFAQSSFRQAGSMPGTDIVIRGVRSAAHHRWAVAPYQLVPGNVCQLAVFRRSDSSSCRRACFGIRWCSAGSAVNGESSRSPGWSWPYCWTSRHCVRAVAAWFTSRKIKPGLSRQKESERVKYPPAAEEFHAILIRRNSIDKSLRRLDGNSAKAGSTSPSLSATLSWKISRGSQCLCLSCPCRSDCNSCPARR